MQSYTHARCLANAYRVNWRIEEVLGDARFDPSKRWLPRSLSAADHVSCLDAEELRRLSHVEMAAYAHLFGYVEEFIAPTANHLARGYELEERVAFDALTNFAAEEVKHMNLFRRLRDRVNDALGFQLERLGGEEETARFVLSKSEGAALLLISAIEWLTQRHYLDAFKDDEGLDAFTRTVFHAHWLEEAQHAQLDHLETLRWFERASLEERERAVDELIELVAAVDGLLQTQVGHDLANLGRALGRGFDAAETEELRAGLLRAKRWTFLESGVSHPRFQELFAAVTTPAQQERVGAALTSLFSDAPALA